jgi:hypothetical protein
MRHLAIERRRPDEPDESRQALGYLAPGLIFFTEIGLLLAVADPTWTGATLLKYTVPAIAVGGPLLLLMAAGGIGFLSRAAWERLTRLSPLTPLLLPFSDIKPRSTTVKAAGSLRDWKATRGDAEWTSSPPRFTLPDTGAKSASICDGWHASNGVESAVRQAEANASLLHVAGAMLIASLAAVACTLCSQCQPNSTLPVTSSLECGAALSFIIWHAALCVSRRRTFSWRKSNYLYVC